MQEMWFIFNAFRRIQAQSMPCRSDLSSSHNLHRKLSSNRGKPVHRPLYAHLILT